VAHSREKRNAYRLGGEIGIPRSRQGDNIKTYDQEIVHGLNSTGSEEGLVEGSTEHSNKLPGFKKCREFDWL
jgi:hypothetical protein